MTETKRSSLASATTMSRRGFVKAAAAAGAVGVAAGSMASASSWFAPAQALAEHGVDGVNHDAFAGAGLARQNIQPRGKVDIAFFDDRYIFDI